MYRCEDRGLVDNDDGLTTDPDFVLNIISDVTVYTRSKMDAAWQYLLERDPAELIKTRRHQRVYCAKYMGESVFSWDSRDVTELEDYYEELCRLVRAENERGSS